MWTFLLFSLLPACFTSEPEVQIRFDPVTQLGVDCQREDDAEACYQYALKMYPEPSEDADYRHAFEMFKRGCDLDHPVACYAAGVIYAEERVPGASDRGLGLFKKACQLKNGVGCNNAGVLLAQQGHVERAAEYYKRGCELESASACSTLARLHSEDKLQNASIEEAVRLADAACMQGEPKGCYTLVAMELRGQAPLPAPMTVQSLLEKGCDAGHASSCFTYADAARRGLNGVPMNPEAADLLSARACELGYEKACQ